MRKVKLKRGETMQMYLFQLIFAAILIVMFVMAISAKSDSRYIKQQIIEKQIALLVESATNGMEFSINKMHNSGFISDIRIEKGRIYADVEGLISIKGYPYFSEYPVSVVDGSNKFIIEVG